MIKLTYKKAQDVLPSDLIEEVQKYLDGGLVYFPKKTARRSWGSVNGTQLTLAKRNQEIKTLYAQGESLEALSKTYCLSEESIRKIVKARTSRSGKSVTRSAGTGKNDYK